MNLPRPTLGHIQSLWWEMARNSALANERKTRDPRAGFSYGWITTGREARVRKSDRKPSQVEGQRTWSEPAWLPLVALAGWCHARSQRLRNEQNGISGSAGLRRIGCASGPPPERRKTAPRQPRQWPEAGISSAVAFLAENPRTDIT